MTDGIEIEGRSTEADIAAARRRVIEQRLAELDKLRRQFRASRRRFKLKAFLQWSALAAARQRRHQNGASHGRLTDRVDRR
jgi:hypothetical protein